MLEPAHSRNAIVRTCASLLAILILLPLPVNQAESAHISNGGSRQASYHSYASFVAEMNALESEHPDIMTIRNLTTTWLGRTVWAAKVTHNPEVNDPNKTEVLIMGAHHGNERIAFEVAFYILKYLLNNYATNETVTKFVNLCEIWFVPMVNPDGYDLNRRKNGRDYALGSYYGVDVNRNYNGSQNGDSNGAWGGSGTSHSPTDSTYCGPYAFSEPEARAIRDLDMNNNFTLSLSYHSSGEEVYWPWGYAKSSEVNTPDYAAQMDIAIGIANRIGYTAMQSGDTYYTTGDSDDYLYGYNEYVTHKGMFPFTIELATIQELPPEDIASVCEQNLPGAMYALEAALALSPVAGLKDAGASGLRLQSTPVANVTNVACVDVTNFGSDSESIPVTIEIKNKTRQAAIPPYYFTNTTSIAVPPGQTKTVAWFWDVPARGNTSYEMRAFTTLANDRHTADDVSTMECSVAGTFGVNLTSQFGQQMAKPMQNVTIPIKLQNAGNSYDEFTVVCTSDKPWAAIDKTNVKLDYFKETTLNLTFTVPSSAQSGDEANATIKATSSGDVSKFANIAFNLKVVMNPPVAEAGANASASVFSNVIFDASNSTGGDYFITSYKWEFGDGAHAFGANVAHAYSMPGSYVATLTITCNNEMNVSDTLFVNVTQDFAVRMDVLPSESIFAVAQGEKRCINITITNAGNGLDDISFAANVTSTSNESASYWQISPVATTMRLNASESCMFKLYINASSRIPAGEYMNVELRAYSNNDTSKKNFTMIEVVSPELENVTMSAIGTLDSKPGVSVTATLRATNFGNADESLELSASTQAGWSAALSASSLFISAGKSATFDVTITPPASALAGSEGIVTIAYKLQGSSISYQREVRVVVEQVHSLRLALASNEGKMDIKGEKGKLISREVRLENLGNGPEVVLIALAPGRSDYSIDNATINVAPRSNASFKLIFDIRESWSATLEVNASASGIGYSLKFPVKVTVLEQNDMRNIIIVIVIIVVIILIVAYFLFCRKRKRNGAR